jgi:high-affinity K+ transport system ATPase subunit B
MNEDYTVEHTTREAVEDRLLAAITKKDQVAVVLTEYDLKRLIAVVGDCTDYWSVDFRRGLETLLKSAFGKVKT